MLIEQDLKDQCQLIQDDLDCILDGIDSDIMNNVCQVIVDRFAILRGQLNEGKPHTGGFIRGING